MKAWAALLPQGEGTRDTFSFGFIVIIVVVIIDLGGKCKTEKRKPIKGGN